MRVSLADWTFAGFKSGPGAEGRAAYAGPTLSNVERQIVADGWSPADCWFLRSSPSLVAFEGRPAK